MNIMDAATNLRVSALIDGLTYSCSGKRNRCYSCQDAQLLCREMKRILEAEPTLLTVPTPVTVCGDVHGQMKDLIQVFEIGGRPPEQTYLFLGDYVDRGDMSVEVILLLFAMKVKYPHNVYLLRGNHESVEMTEVFGFMDECKKKLNRRAWKEFMGVFEYLPLAAVVGGKYFCVHGGLSPSLVKPEDVAAIRKPVGIPESGLISDLLWSDPSAHVNEWGPNERGNTLTWGKAVAERFLKRNGMTCIIRGHQMVQNGYQFPFGNCKNMVTVFTASRYAGEYANNAACALINEELVMTFTVLPRWVPPKKEGCDNDSQKNDRPATARRMGTKRQLHM